MRAPELRRKPWPRKRLAETVACAVVLLVAPLGCGGAAADLVFAILLGAGEEDLVLLLAEAEVRAGACEAGGGATGAGGCGLLAGAGAGLGFLAGGGAGVDFALAGTAGAADTATDGDAE